MDTAIRMKIMERTSARIRARRTLSHRDQRAHTAHHMPLPHTVIFRSEFLGEFLSVLLPGVGAGPGAGGGGVDFAAFRHAFLPAFPRSLPGLAPHHAALLNNFPSDTVCIALYTSLTLTPDQNEH
ncbi:uncharacterized protein LOC123723380 [Papilio machaon]|uniref:uncharacterized protein LOC123723281 n=1 Tax=Papilio machaon TaxID=76193 RepID=UPI001E665487|nr:uncharacterized protein LOC123723281 [Papilio machaon]XP_045541910.1 uncharacterized protein LOC123723380 [Papilio machaon]